MPAPSQDLIDRLSATAMEGREVIRGIHEATKDARNSFKETQQGCKAAEEHLKKVISSAFDDDETYAVLLEIKNMWIKYQSELDNIVATKSALETLHARASGLVEELSIVLSHAKASFGGNLT